MAIIFVNSQWAIGSEEGIDCWYTTNDNGIATLSKSEGGTPSTCYATIEDAITAASDCDTIYVYSNSNAIISGNPKSAYSRADAISYYGTDRKTLSIEAYRIEAGLNTSVSGNITLNIHCTGSGSNTTLSQLKVTGIPTDVYPYSFTVSYGAVLNLTANNIGDTPFTNGTSLKVDGATVTVTGGTFNNDPLTGRQSCSAVFNNDALIIADSFLNNREKNTIGITGSTFEIGTWTVTDNERTFTGGIVTNKGTITVKNSTFRAGDVTNTGTITVTDSTFRAVAIDSTGPVSFTKEEESDTVFEAEVGMFTNNGGNANTKPGLIVGSGVHLTAEGLTNPQSKLIVISGIVEIKDDEDYCNISNSGEIRVSGEGASLFAHTMDMSEDGTTKRGSLTVEDGAAATFSGLLGLNTGYSTRMITVSGGATLSAGRIKITGTSNVGGIISVDAHSLVKVTGVDGTISGGTVNVVTTSENSSNLLTEDNHTYLVVNGTLENSVTIGVNGVLIDRSNIDGTDVGNGYFITTQGGKGIWLTNETQDTLYVNSAYTEEMEGYGYNKFSTPNEFTVAKGTGGTVEYGDTTAISFAENTRETSYGTATTRVFYADNDVSLYVEPAETNPTNTAYLAYGHLFLMKPVTYVKANPGDAYYKVMDGETEVTDSYAAPTFTIESGSTFEFTKSNSSGLLRVGNIWRNDGDGTGGIGNLDVQGTLKSAVYAGPYSHITVTGELFDRDTPAELRFGSFLRPHSSLTVSRVLTSDEQSGGAVASTSDTPLQLDLAKGVSFADGGTLTLNNTHGAIRVLRFYHDTATSLEPTDANITLNNAYVESDDSLYSYAGNNAPHTSKFFVFNYEYTSSTDPDFLGNINMDILNGSTLVVRDGDFNPNAKTTVTVSGSTVIATSVTNNGTFRVSGNSSLKIGNADDDNKRLTGNAITVTTGATLNDSVIYGDGNMDTVDISCAGAMSFDGTSALYGVKLSVANTLTNTGTLTVDATSLITASDITNNGTITVDGTGYSSGMVKAINVADNATLTLANISLADGAPDGVRLLQGQDKDIYVGVVDLTTLYVNSAWSTPAHLTGEEVAEGQYYGVNAFTAAAGASSAATSATSRVMFTGGNSDTYGDLTLTGAADSVELSVVSETGTALIGNLTATGKTVVNTDALTVGGTLSAGIIVNSGTLTVGGTGSSSVGAIETAGTITVNTGATLTATGAIETAGTITVTGTLNANAGINNVGTITVDGTLSSGTNSITNAGTITVNGTLSSGAIDNDGEITVTGTLSSGAIDNNGGTIILGGTFDATPAITVSGDGNRLAGGSVVLNATTCDFGSASTIKLIDSAITLDSTDTANYITVYDGEVAPAKIIQENGAITIGGTDYRLVTQGGTGLYLTKETQSTLYVYATEEAAKENHVYGYNSFSSFLDALTVAANAEGAVTISVEQAVEETIGKDWYYLFNNNLAVAGKQVTIHSNGYWDLCLTSANDKQIELSNEYVFSGHAGMWPIFAKTNIPSGDANSVVNGIIAGTIPSGATDGGKVFIYKPITSQQKIGFQGNTEINTGAKITAPHLSFRAGTGTITVIGDKSVYKDNVYQLDGRDGNVSGTPVSGALIFASGTLNITNSNVWGKYFQFNDDNKVDGGSFTLNSSNTTWTIDQDMKNYFYKDHAPGSAQAYTGEFNFTNGSILNVKGNLLNVLDGDNTKGFAGHGTPMTINLTTNSLMTVDGNMENAGTITIDSSNPEYYYISVGGNVLNREGGVISISGSGFQVDGEEKTVTNNGTFNVSGTSKLVINKLTGNAIQLQNGARIVNSTITSGGTLNVGTHTVDAEVVGNSVQFYHSSMSYTAVDNSGSITVYDTVSSGAIDNKIAAATITVTGTLYSGDIRNSGVGTSSGGITVNGTLNSGDIDNDGEITVNGTLNSGAIDNAGGTIILGGTFDSTPAITVSGDGNRLAGGSVVLNATTCDFGTASTIKLIDSAITLDSGTGFITVYNGAVDPEKIVHENDTITIGEQTYTLVTQGGTGLFLTKETQSTLYVNSEYTESSCGGHVYGYNAFSNLADALSAAVSETATITLLSNSTASDSGDRYIAFGNSGVEINGAFDGEIDFASGHDLCLTPKADGSLTIAAGTRIATVGDKNSAYIVLNYGRTTGTVTVNGTLESSTEIALWGTTTVGTTGSLIADHDGIILFRSGYAAAANGAYTTDYAVTIGELGEADKPEIRATWFDFASGVVNINNATVTATKFLYSQNLGGNGAYEPSEAEFAVTDTIRKAVLNSHDVTWEIGDFEADGNGDRTDGTKNYITQNGEFNFTGSQIDVSSNASFGNMIALNLTDTVMNVDGILENAGTITLSKNTAANGSTLTVAGTASNSAGTVVLNENGAIVTAETSYGITITDSQFDVDGAFANTGAIYLNTSSMITAASINNASVGGPRGKIVIDASDYSDAVTKKQDLGLVFTLNVETPGAATPTTPTTYVKVLDVQGNEGTTLSVEDVILTGAVSGVCLLQLEDGDICVGRVDQSTLYVNSTWDYNTGEEISGADGEFYGYNAFSGVENAIAAAKNNTDPEVIPEIIIENLGTQSQTGYVYDSTQPVIQLSDVKTTIESSETTYQKAIYGGTKLAAAGTATRNTDITIETGTFNKFFVGGNNIAMPETDTAYTVNGETQTVAISGGVFTAIVATGDRVQKGAFTLNSDLEMNISGGQFNYFVAGGLLNSLYENTGEEEVTNGTAVINGNVSLTITGGSFADACWIYGGNLATNKASASKASTINGDVVVTINCGAGNTITLSHLVAGSYGWSEINKVTQTTGGNTKLVFKGNGTNLSFTENGELWGGCSSDNVSLATGKCGDSFVEGDRLLSFEGFTGSLNCKKVRDFSSIQLIHESGVTLTESTVDLRGIENWTFEEGSSLSGNFGNDFKDDTLTLNLMTVQTEPWTIMENRSGAFNGFGDLFDNAANFDNEDEFADYRATHRLTVQVKTETMTQWGWDSDNNCYSGTIGDYSGTLALDNTKTKMILTLASSGSISGV